MESADRHERFLAQFLRHQDEIAAVVGSMVRDPHLREDIVQEVAMVLWRKFDEYDPSRPFGAWARGIAVRKVLQAWARQQRLPSAMAPETMEAILAGFDQTESEAENWAEREAALEHCIGKLPQRSQRLLDLRYREGLSLQAIAERLSSTLDAVNKALSRLRRALRECVEQRLAEAGG
ncbi:MAG: sigma-70 family RNA polymerase sigma factor [Kiritimatiellae bacterium]|nr:sigma-70 family RNA polymerase sigma factor [Kiritimatiellia bacterium]